MATAITLAIGSPTNPGASWRVFVDDNFDEVFDKIYPLTPVTSSLEGRANLVYTTTDGRRITILPQQVVSIEEAVDE